MVYLLIGENNCPELFWNTSIKIEIMVWTNQCGRTDARMHPHSLKYHCDYYLPHHKQARQKIVWRNAEKLYCSNIKFYYLDALYLHTANIISKKSLIIYDHIHVKKKRKLHFITFMNPWKIYQPYKLQGLLHWHWSKPECDQILNSLWIWMF